MTMDPSQVPEPEVKPSSTPDGPQTIPTPHDPRASNPNSGGDAGLSGDMGLSSERTGPWGGDPADAGVEGTGSKGTAVGQTDGTVDTSPTEWDAVDVSQTGVRTAPQPDGTGASSDDAATVDRTVGEPRPQPIADEKSRRP